MTVKARPSPVAVPCTAPRLAQSTLPQQLALGEGCQRWFQRRARYRPPGEPFEPGRCEVALIDESIAKPWVIQHHYSGSFPAARLRVGLFIKDRLQRSQLGGVAVFSVPMNQDVVPCHLGVPASAGVELGRLVLLDHPLLAANAETWFLARAFRLARRELACAGIVAYCDPVARIDNAGQVVKRGHTGTIYTAHNGRFAGRSSPRTLTLLPNGQVLNDRTLSKLRTDDVGAAYAQRLLLDAGCRRRAAGETPTAYLRALAEAGTLRRERHPGNLVFTWLLSPPSGQAAGKPA